MARISTYELDNSITIEDIIIGTDGDTGMGMATKNFSMGDLAEFVMKYVEDNSSCCGGNTPTTPVVVKYGYLYNWFAANDSRNIASTGWSVPTISNQRTLSTFLGGNTVAGGKMKETGLTYWLTPNTGATNTSGFNGRGGGTRIAETGVFDRTKDFMQYWAQGFNASGGYVSVLKHDFATYTAYNGSITYSFPEKTGSAVRLIKDTTSLSNGQTGTYTGNDGKVYRTICIGTQEWLADNLLETKYRDLSAVPEVTDNTTWAGLTTGARCSYDNDPNNAL